jgi:integrase/recombinase XerD
MKKPRYEVIYNRKKKLNSKGLALVQVRVYHNYQVRYYSTGVYVAPESFHPDKWIIKHKDADNLNNKIRETIHDLEVYEYKARANNEPYDFNMLPTSNKEKSDFITYMKNGLESENFAPGTRRQHRSTHNHLLDFGKIVRFSDITLANIQAFDTFLRKTITEQSSIYGQHKRLKKWVRKALMDEYITRDPYLQFRSSPGNRNVIRYLGPEDLSKLEKEEIHNKRLKIVRDIFLFSCYTGLAYQELEGLTEKHISKDDEGMTWITGERLKVSQNANTSATGFYMIPLHPKAISILEKYKGSREGYCLPVTGNVQYNLMLKEVQALCEIEARLTSHVARHTFATTFTLAKGISLETVKEMLGHSSIRMTEKYAKVLKSRVKEDMKKIF